MPDNPYKSPEAEADQSIRVRQSVVVLALALAAAVALLFWLATEVRFVQEYDVHIEIQQVDEGEQLIESP